MGEAAINGGTVARSARLYLVNGSTLVKDEDVAKMAHAINVQIRDHAAEAWGQRAVVEFHTGKDLAAVQASVPRQSWVMIVLDKSDSAGALGWHSTDDKDRIYSEVFAKPCLDAGSTALTGPYAISSVASHEALEILGDRFCNGYADTGKGLLVATEISDPVEADGYLIDGVQVSNFVLPEWFDPTGSAGEKYDYLGKATAPFTMTKGGYWIQMPSSTETAKWGETVKWETEVGFDVRQHGGRALVFSPEMPEWKRDLKLHHGRNALKRSLAT